MCSGQEDDGCSELEGEQDNITHLIIAPCAPPEYGMDFNYLPMCPHLGVELKFDNVFMCRRERHRQS